jgi:hypothetical protein
MMRLKARIYLWSEATDFKTFAANNEGDGSSEAVLVSLFRDLGAADLDATLGQPRRPVARRPNMRRRARPRPMRPSNAFSAPIPILSLRFAI